MKKFSIAAQILKMATAFIDKKDSRKILHGVLIQRTKKNRVRVCSTDGRGIIGAEYELTGPHLPDGLPPEIEKDSPGTGSGISITGADILDACKIAKKKRVEIGFPDEGGGNYPLSIPGMGGATMNARGIDGAVPNLETIMPEGKPEYSIVFDARRLALMAKSLAPHAQAKAGAKMIRFDFYGATSPALIEIEHPAPIDTGEGSAVDTTPARVFGLLMPCRVTKD